MRARMEVLKDYGWQLKQRLEYEKGKYQVRSWLQKPSALPDCDPELGLTLFFAPEAGLKPHLAAMCILARTLKQLGHSVLFARCYELFARCAVMDMYRH